MTNSPNTRNKGGRPLTLVPILNPAPPSSGPASMAFNAPIPTPAPIPELISIREAAGMLGIHHTTLNEMCNKRAFPFVQIGKRKLIERHALAEWIAAHRVPARQANGQR